MTLYWRSVITATLVFSIVFSFHPVQYAHASGSSAQWQDIKDILDLGKPVRRGETFAEAYYRLETRMSSQQKEEFGVLNKRMKYQMPMYRVSNDVKVTDTSITLSENGQSLVIEVKAGKDDKPFIVVNGRTLKEKEALSPLKTYAILEGLVKKEAPKAKGAWLWNMFVPQADAFFGNMSWGTLLTGAAVIGGLGFLIYKKIKDGKSGSCKNKSAICCNVSGTLTQLSSGCCADAGGSDTAYTTCPAAMYIEGETTPSATVESTGTGTTTIEANTTTNSTGTR